MIYINHINRIVKLKLISQFYNSNHNTNGIRSTVAQIHIKARNWPQRNVSDRTQLLGFHRNKQQRLHHQWSHYRIETSHDTRRSPFSREWSLQGAGRNIFSYISSGHVKSSELKWWGRLGEFSFQGALLGQRDEAVLFGFERPVNGFDGWKLCEKLYQSQEWSCWCVDSRRGKEDRPDQDEDSRCQREQRHSGSSFWSIRQGHQCRLWSSIWTCIGTIIQRIEK